MPQNIDKLLAWQCRSLVLLEQGNSLGTGFFIAPGLILTCAHVVDANSDEPVVAKWREREIEARIIVASPHQRPGDKLYPYPDLAVLRLAGEQLPEHPCLWLDDRQPDLNTPLTFAGFSTLYTSKPKISSGVVNRVGIGEVGETFRVRDDEFVPGMSGGPVMNPSTGGVCGVVRTTRMPGTNLGGLVTPTRGLRALGAVPYRDLRCEHDQSHAGSESRRVRVVTAPSPRNISPDEERALRAILATVSHNDEHLQLGSGPRRDDVHYYGDVVIDMDEDQTGEEPIPPALAYVAELGQRTETPALRRWARKTARRMGFARQLRSHATNPDPSRPRQPTGGWGRDPRVQAAVVLVIVAALTYSVIVWSDGRGAPVGCGQPTQLRVLTSSEQLGAYRQVADAFETWSAKQHGGCRAADLHVYAAPAGTAREALTNGWTNDPAKPDETQYLRDVGPLPDVWLPGSQVELDAVVDRLPVAGDRELIATTPLVLGVPASRTAGLGRAPASWRSVLDTAITTGTHVVRPDPATTVVGELATVALYTEPDTAPSTPRDVERWLERSLDAGRYPIGGSEELLCRQRQLTGPARPAAVITSEQALARYNNGDPLGSRCARGAAPDRLTAVYPTDTLRVDLYFVPLRWGRDVQSAATRDQAKAWGAWLTGTEGKNALLAVGLRPPDTGGDLATPLTEDNGVAPEWPFGNEPRLPGADVRTAAHQTYTDARRPGRVLLAVDASGSMNEPVGNQGTTRFGIAMQGVAASLPRMHEQRDELGLWLFSTRADPSWVKQVLPIGRKTASAADLLNTGRQEWRPGGDTPLYRTMTAGVRTVGAYDDGAVNALVVLTDGHDTASRDWFDDLGREIAANQEVRIFLVAVGDVTCAAEDFVQLVNDTAGQCLSATASTVDDTLTTLFRILWTKG